MADYSKMYRELFRAVTKAIGILQEAQISSEEIFMDSEETVIRLVTD